MSLLVWTTESTRHLAQALGAVEQLPSGRFRARVLGPDGQHVSAPSTFATRTDAGERRSMCTRERGSGSVFRGVEASGAGISE
ncbi:MAG: hypothetical protein ACYCXA_09775 [Actinomycetes bacterium]